MSVILGNNSYYIIRNYRFADFNSYVQLNEAAEKEEPRGRFISIQAMTEHLHRPNFHPEQDLFVVEMAGNLVGYTEVIPELPIGRIILNCWVHPEHRRRGLSRKLLSYTIPRAKELGVKAAQANVREDNSVARSVLSRLGFECVRRFLELRLDMDKVCQPYINQAICGGRYLRLGEENKLTLMQNRCFAGFWGYCPNTVEEISYRLSLSHCSPEDVVLICDGDKIIGYCWTEVIDKNEAIRGTSQGRIFMLGTDPDYRGKGIGKRALLAGLAYLKNKGVLVTELMVDSENKIACALYQSVGFEIVRSSLWYEKVVI